MAILHARGSIWKERVVFTAENEQLKHGLSILKPSELVQLPKRWQRLVVGVTKKGGRGVGVLRETRQTQLPNGGLRTSNLATTPYTSRARAIQLSPSLHKEELDNVETGLH